MIRAALVTGGGRGIGRAIAHTLGGPDTFVAIAGRTRSQLQVTTADLERLGGKALAIEVDVTDDASVAAGMRTLRDVSPRIDVLVNNAGV